MPAADNAAASASAANTQADALRDWLRLTLISGIGGETQRKLLAAFGLPEAIFQADAASLRQAVGEAMAAKLLAARHDDAIVSALNAQIEAALLWANQPGNTLLTLADSAYPQRLLTGADPPVLLYVKGRVELLQNEAIAIVGARTASPQGEDNAHQFAAALAAAGLTVISGLALGIDAAAHRGALHQAGSTLAVIGTGADRIYPKTNETLTRQIATSGALISEFPLGTPPLGANFPRRNRIIAGMSRGCLVVEAAERSGSLITARLASECGAEVFAIPGSIHSPLAKGCHKLIKQGAKLVERAEDILEELRWERVVAPEPRPASAAAAAAEQQAEDEPLLAALGFDPCDLDTLAARSAMSAESLLARLLALELAGQVAVLPGGKYQRLRG